MRFSQWAAAVLVGSIILQRTFADEITYRIDDGTAELGAGLNRTGDLILINSFPTGGVPATISSISVAFGGPVGTPANSLLLGQSFRVVLWSDPVGLGNPLQAQVLAVATGILTSINSNAFITVPILPTTVTTANFFVGVVMTAPGGTFPGALDMTPPMLSNRSFLAAGEPGLANIFNLGANTEVPLSAIGPGGLYFSGQWLIRANGTVPETGSSLLLLSAGFAALAVARRFRGG